MSVFAFLSTALASFTCTSNYEIFLYLRNFWVFFLLGDIESVLKCTFLFVQKQKIVNKSAVQCMLFSDGDIWLPTDVS